MIAPRSCSTSFRSRVSTFPRRSISFKSGRWLSNWARRWRRRGGGAGSWGARVAPGGGAVEGGVLGENDRPPGGPPGRPAGVLGLGPGVRRRVLRAGARALAPPVEQGLLDRLGEHPEPAH